MFQFFKKLTGTENSQIVAPADGTMFAIEDVKDDVFSQKILGDGVAFRYEGDSVTVCAPADGTLSVIFPTGHAFGITMPNGVELLVHIGIDTVSAKGAGFQTLGKEQGDKVTAGEPVIQADLKKLRENFDMSTMLIISDSNGKTARFSEVGEVKKGQPVCTLS